MATANRLLVPMVALAAGIALSACAPSDDKYKPQPPMAGKVLFSVTGQQLPYPADPFFFSKIDVNNTPADPTDDITDGTLNIPAAAAWHVLRNAVNMLDGWSTSADILVGFSEPIDPASINGSSVAMIKLWVDPFTKAPTTNPAFLPAGATSPVADVLTYGEDFTASVSQDTTSNGNYLVITPLKPLDKSSGPAVNGPNKILNVGYLVVLTNSLMTTNGTTMGPSDYYQGIVNAPADCSTFTNSEKIICQFTKGGRTIIETAAPLTGINPASVIMSWSFSTQSIDDTLNIISLTSTPKPALIVPTGSTTAVVNEAFTGKADIFVGSTQLTYYLTPPANANDTASVMTKYWSAASAPPAPLVTPPGQPNALTMFNPVPAPVAPVTVPILVTIPNATSACAGRPPGGWPVAIVQHGITRNRTDALMIAETLADACTVMVSMDLPLHGLTSPAESPFYCTPALPQCIGATERMFGLDIQNNTTGALVPDGQPDPSAGVNATIFMNLGSALTSRDNLRQAEADQIQLTKSVPGLAIAPGTPLPAGPIGVDPTRISFIGLSLGSIVGGTHTHFANDLSAVSLSVPGGVITKLLLDSETFGPAIKAGLAAQGLVPGSFVFNTYFTDFQTVIDSADPINHIADVANMHPLFLMKVIGDDVVPNNSTDRLITAAGLNKLTNITQPNPVGPGNGAYVEFDAATADHGTLFDFSNVLSTLEMQSQVAGFGASTQAEGGPFVTLGTVSSDVLDLSPAN
jgi:hypothetical protein